MGTPLGPKYIPYTYMDPLGHEVIAMCIYKSWRWQHGSLGLANLALPGGCRQGYVKGLGSRVEGLEFRV